MYFHNTPLLVVSCFSSCIPFVATILIDVECMMISTAMLLTKLLAQKQKRDQDATLALLSISNYVALSPVQSQNIEGVMRRTLHCCRILYRAVDRLSNPGVLVVIYLPLFLSSFLKLQIQWCSEPHLQRCSLIILSIQEVKPQFYDSMLFQSCDIDDNFHSN